MGEQFGSQHQPDGVRHDQRERLVARGQLTQCAHRRQGGKALAAKTLHAPAFMVDGDEHIGALGANGIGERAQLGAVGEIARKQN